MIHISSVSLSSHTYSVIGIGFGASLSPLYPIYNVGLENDLVSSWEYLTTGRNVGEGRQVKLSKMLFLIEQALA